MGSDDGPQRDERVEAEIARKTGSSVSEQFAGVTREFQPPACARLPHNRQRKQAGAEDHRNTHRTHYETDGTGMKEAYYGCKRYKHEIAKLQPIGDSHRKTSAVISINGGVRRQSQEHKRQGENKMDSLGAAKKPTSEEASCGIEDNSHAEGQNAPARQGRKKVGLALGRGLVNSVSNVARQSHTQA
jgi:hypothetical protein